MVIIAQQGEMRRETIPTNLPSRGYKHKLYNNKINARVLIGQSAMVYCAGKPMEKSRVF